MSFYSHIPHIKKVLKNIPEYGCAGRFVMDGGIWTLKTLSRLWKIWVQGPDHQRHWIERRFNTQHFWDAFFSYNNNSLGEWQSRRVIFFMSGPGDLLDVCGRKIVFWMGQCGCWQWRKTFKAKYCLVLVQHE